MSLFQQSSLTLANAEQFVAEQCNKQGTAEMLARARRSIQAAIRHWNKDRWNWLLTQASDISVVSGTSAYALPYDYRDMYTVRLSGSPAVPLRYADQRMYDRIVFNQTQQYTPCAYTLFKHGGTGMIELLPNPNAANTLILKYYRRLVVPMTTTSVVTVGTTSGSANITAPSGGFAGITLGSPITGSGTGIPASTKIKSITSSAAAVMTANATVTESVTATIGGANELLDIPEDYEWDIMAWACHHFAIGVGGSPDRVSYFLGLSGEGLARAKKADRLLDDQDLSFQSVPMGSPPFLAPPIVQT